MKPDIKINDILTCKKFYRKQKYSGYNAVFFENEKYTITHIIKIDYQYQIIQLKIDDITYHTFSTKKIFNADYLWDYFYTPNEIRNKIRTSKLEQLNQIR